MSVSPFVFAPPVTRLVSGLKNGPGILQARILSALAAPVIAAAYRGHSPPHLIVPMPITYRRRFRRGYNQAALLARFLSRELSVPTHYRLLGRTRHTPAQRGLDRSQRQRNVRNAFRSSPLAGERIALIDDVVTTGATVSAATTALMSAGAAEVHVWMTARTLQG